MDDFFSVLENSENGTGFMAIIELNPSHIVYSGHFPGHPVTPGVIQLQIVHELLENHFGRKLKLETMSQCKFLNVLNPDETSRLVVTIEYTRIDELLKVKAWGDNGTTIFFKLNSVYQFDP